MASSSELEAAEVRQEPRVAGIPELVRDGIHGWLVPAGSADDLTVALREVLAAPPERLEAMGKAGAVRVAERHDVRQEAAKLASQFRQSVGV